jgi:tetratricopeptide (TPR) repeat protein
MTTPRDLLAKLDTLRALDPKMELFGANTHRYALAPPLSLAQVEVFEAQHRVRLPSEYRRFLQEAGGSGAGPVYGLAPLEPWTPDGFTQVYTRITDKTGEVVTEAGTGPRPGLARPADPSRPFPLTGAWGPPAEDGSNVEGAFPADANPFDGCAYLADIGCGYCYFLVITGERAGEVWVDYTAGNGKISPTGKGFFAWYDDWLDQGLAERATEAMELAMKRGDAKTPDLSRHVALLEGDAERSPTWAMGRLRLGIARAYEGRYAEAEADFARAVELEPRLALKVAVARCASLWSQGRLDDMALAAAEGLASSEFSFPARRELHEVQVLALRLLGRFAEAIAASDDRIAFEPRALVAWLDKAHVEVLAGAPVAAETTIRKAASQGGEPDRETLVGGFRALAERLSVDPDRTSEAARWPRRATELKEPHEPSPTSASGLCSRTHVWDAGPGPAPPGESCCLRADGDDFLLCGRTARGRARKCRMPR